MQQDFLRIFASVLGVFFVIGLGAFCRRRDWLTREADRTLATLTANVFLPALFLTRILQGDTFDSLAVAWVPPAFGFGLTALGILLAWTIARTLGASVGLAEDNQQRAFALAAGICNYGYIPLPLAQLFYPDAEVDLILHNVGVDLALWSVGIAIITGGDTSNADRPARWRAIASPPLIAVATGLLIKQTLLFDWMPGSLLRSIGWLGECAIPLGLLLSGAIIIDFVSDSQWKGALRPVVAAIGFRQLLMPVIMLGAAAALATTIDMKQVLMLQAAMPSAVFPIVLAKLYNRDTTTALRVVLATSLVGMLLIPIWLAIGNWWLFG